MVCIMPLRDMPRMTMGPFHMAASGSKAGSKVTTTRNLFQATLPLKPAGSASSPARAT